MFSLVVQIHQSGDRTADSCAFRESPVQIGRSPINDLWLKEDFVSRRHAAVSFHGNRTTYVDLDSRNASTIDGQPIRPFVEIPVDSNSDVRIGPLRLHLHREPAEQVDAALFGRPRNSAFMATSLGEPGRPNHETLFLPPPNELAEAPTLPGVAEALAALRGAAKRGDPLLEGYRGYRQAASDWLEVVRADLEARLPDERERHVMALQKRFPELSSEAGFRSLVAELGVEPLRVGHLDVEDWLRRLTQNVFPPRGAPINLAMTLERLGEVLEVFSAAFIDSRVAHEEFARRFGVERHNSVSMLERIEDGHGILAYLLNPNREGSERSGELARTLAEFTLHQLASVSAVIEGARQLLDSLAPSALNAAPSPPRDATAFEQESAFARVWPHTARALWRKFLVRRHELAQSDRFEHELFGAAFARRYYAIAGTSSTPSTKP